VKAEIGFVPVELTLESYHIARDLTQLDEYYQHSFTGLPKILDSVHFPKIFHGLLFPFTL